MMASEYKKRGGEYTTDKGDKDESQKHLDNWTEEEWQTKDGSGKARNDDGTEQRYLPKKAWEQMNEDEKEETDAQKQKGSKQGKQYVENTPKAKQARKDASKGDGDLEDQRDVENGRDETSNSPKKGNTEAKDCNAHWEDAAQSKDEHDEYRKFKDQERVAEEEHSEQGERTDSEHHGSEEAENEEEITNKRGRGVNQRGPNKKQKKSGRKDQPNGTAGDKSRVPEVGQKVQWKALPGIVDGEVMEVVYEEKQVDGKTVKGSKEDPRIVLKSSSSGKIAIHKPEVVYFD